LVCDEVVFISGFEGVFSALASERFRQLLGVQHLAQQLELLALGAVQHPRLGLQEHTDNEHTYKQ
jgi:hypothetical protein